MSANVKERHAESFFGKFVYSGNASNKDHLQISLTLSLQFSVSQLINMNIIIYVVSDHNEEVGSK